MESRTLTPKEAEMICKVFGFTREEFRENYMASSEKPEWCAYWRNRLANSVNARIRASIATEKREAA